MDNYGEVSADQDQDSKEDDRNDQAADTGLSQNGSASRFGASYGVRAEETPAESTGYGHACESGASADSEPESGPVTSLGANFFGERHVDTAASFGAPRPEPSVMSNRVAAVVVQEDRGAAEKPVPAMGVSVTGGQADHEAADDMPMKAASGEDLVAFDLDKITFTQQAAYCIRRAQLIAASLNQAIFGEAHLVLAMTLDPEIQARMEKRLDVQAARRVMLRKLSASEWQFGLTEEPNIDPKVGHDLAQIVGRAATEARERGQSVSLLDLFRGLDDARGWTTLLDGKAEVGPDFSHFAAQMGQALQGRLNGQLAEYQNVISERIGLFLQAELPAAIDQRMGEALSRYTHQIADSIVAQIWARLEREEPTNGVERDMDHMDHPPSDDDWTWRKLFHA